MASVAVYCLFSWGGGGKEEGEEGNGLLPGIIAFNPASLRQRAEWAVEVTAGSTRKPALHSTNPFSDFSRWSVHP